VQVHTRGLNGWLEPQDGERFAWTLDWGVARELGADLETLFKLQELDVRLREKQLEIESYEKKLAARRAAMDDLRARIDALTERRKQLVTERALAERRVSDSEDELKERRQRLSRVRNERELRAGESEVAALRDEIDQQQDAFLATTTRVDEVEGELEALRKEFADLEQADHRHVEDEAAHIDDLKADLGQGKSERDLIAKDLDGSLRQRYEMVFSRRNGLAVVEVRNGSCGGCHMGIPPQTVIEIMRSGAVRVCPSCQRILYAKDATEAAS
jgi:predicted  nucleic acid-binding Zn-ribbon protein